jgi:hypothetical protein
MSVEKVFCYIGRCKGGCGVIRSAAVDRPKYKEDTAKFVAEIVRDGMTVERIPVEECRVQFGHCKCPRPQAELPLDEPPQP